MTAYSSRIRLNGKDHTDVYYQGHYHDAVYIGNQKVWEKLKGVLKITLSWGSSPRDLDSHITGPKQSGGRFHVYFSAESYSEGSVVLVDLDVDDTSSYGPEHTTIRRETSGRYRFSVHDYTNRASRSSTSLSGSGACVTVAYGDTVVKTFRVPESREGTVWVVFEYENGVIYPVNTFYYQPSPSAIT